MDQSEAYQDEPQDQQVDPQAFVQAVTQSDNLAADMPDDQLSEIAQQCLSDYDMDKDSMAEWFEVMDRGLELARLAKKEKDYPFKGAANIKYPLLTSAALQFNARAYPAIVPPDRIVKAKVWGADAQGLKAARAERISEHMSWQLHAQVTEWEEETDKLLVQLPIVGTMIRKWWYDPIEARPRCRTVAPGRFIVNDHVKVLDEAPRCTEEISLYPQEITERKRMGQYREDFELDTTGEDKQGPQEFIEQHTRIDLDEDGYPEPYVVTIHVDQRKVVRIVADFGPEDVRFASEMQPQPVQVPVIVGQDTFTGQPLTAMTTQMQPQEVITGIASVRRGTYFVAHQFLPSMDGGFWGTGLGILLGDISDSINTILNQMLDASHYNTLGGGFIGSEFRLKGGAQRLRPGEWRQVAANGGDVRQAIVPMQWSGPDATMFQLLGMLIDAGREIASVKDIVTGESPKNQTATATLAMIEQGMMVFTAAYKRIFRACATEYGMLARINRDTVDPETYARFHDEQTQPQQGPDGQMIPPQMAQLDPAADYDASDMDVQPVADPRSVTKMQQAAKAQFVMQLAEQGLVNPQEATARIAEAMDLEDVESLIPQPDPMQAQMAQFQMQVAQADLTMKMVEIDKALAEIEKTKAETIETIASAQNEQARTANEAMKTRLDGLKAILEDERNRMAAMVRGDGRMARASGNGATARAAGPANGGAQGGAAIPLVGGAGGSRGGALGADPLGGMGGGLF